MKLSIIIVNWNTIDLLANCLASIHANPPEDQFEIWVIDNCSTDGSSRMVKERFPEVNLIENSQNIGFARANNQALAKSGGDFILLLNPDTLLAAGSIDQLTNFLGEHPDGGAVGPRLVQPDGTLQLSAFPQPTLFREFWRMFHLDALYCVSQYRMKDWSLNKPRQVDSLLGACMLMRRTALNSLGKFDEEFFVYSEEVDLCLRMRKAGWQLYWMPESIVVHYGGKSTQQVPEDMFLRLYEGKILYFRKHHSRLSVLIYKLILFTASIVRLMLTPFVIFESPTKRDEHLVLFKNYQRLLSVLPSI